MSAPPLRSPLAFLDLSQVIEAVEAYVAIHRPDLADEVATHQIELSEKGTIVWTLHGGERVHGRAVIERVTRRAAVVDPTAA